MEFFVEERNGMVLRQGLRQKEENERKNKRKWSAVSSAIKLSLFVGYGPEAPLPHNHSAAKKLPFFSASACLPLLLSSTKRRRAAELVDLCWWLKDKELIKVEWERLNGVLLLEWKLITHYSGIKKIYLFMEEAATQFNFIQSSHSTQKEK